jgi:hypothetical protein
MLRQARGLHETVLDREHGIHPQLVSMRNLALVFWNRVPRGSQQTTKIAFAKKMLRPSDVSHETFLGQDLSDLLVRMRSGSPYVVGYAHITDFASLVVICRYVRNTAKAGRELLHNHVKRVVSYLFLDLPLLVAAWKRRKTFMVVRSEASMCFSRTRCRTAASSDTG